MLAPAQTPVFFTQNCPLSRCICGRLLPTIGICNTAIAGFLTFCYFSGERFFCFIFREGSTKNGNN